MTRSITLDELKKEHFLIENLECHRQKWKDGSEWLGNAVTPRLLYGLCFICSDISASYFEGNNKAFEAHHGDVIYIPKNCIYKARFKGGDKSTDIYTVNFIIRDKDGNELRLFDRLGIVKNVSSVVCIDIASELANAFLFSKSELKKQALFFRLIDDLAYSSSSNSEIYRKIKKGVALLRNEWNQNEKIKKYADICEISESGFYALFKQWSGKSPIDYRNSIRITAAKSMLENSNMNISEISFSVGFEDQYYFSRIFKRIVGLSPKEFRKK